MKKSNIIISVIAVLLSAFLLWLWYYLGFDKIDSPLDLLVSIGWWVIIIGTIVGIAKMEKIRKEKIRTAYIGSGFLFNSESGTVALEGRTAIEVLEETLKGLKYDFTNSGIDDITKAGIKAVVRTKHYEAASEETQEPTWQGEVALASPGAKALPFMNRAELAGLLADMA